MGNCPFIFDSFLCPENRSRKWAKVSSFAFSNKSSKKDYFHGFLAETVLFWRGGQNKKYKNSSHYFPLSLGRWSVPGAKAGAADLHVPGFVAAMVDPRLAR
jgi:hypothetical protein